jgi:hypothetical protein
MPLWRERAPEAGSRTRALSLTRIENAPRSGPSAEACYPTFMTHPSLVKASALAPGDVGAFAWDASHNSDILTVSSDRLGITWGPRKPEYSGKFYPPAFVPAKTTARLHSGAFGWDFLVEEMANRQIGIGFMLLWDNGLLDWGFFGYLGAGSTAWAYDPSTGDIVTGTRSICGGLPKFQDARRGIVSVDLVLPRDAPGRGTFTVNGVVAPAIELPVGAVVVPAACLLAETQSVTLCGRFAAAT